MTTTLTKFQSFKNYFSIIFGVLIYVIGLNLFLSPSKVFTVGVLGFSQELSFIFTNSFDIAGIFYLILNIPIMLLAWYKVGKKFTIRTILVIVFITILQQFIPTTTDLLNDPLLNVITGSLLVGTGLGLVLKQGGSTGGFDVVAMYISLVYAKGFNLINIILNVAIIALACYITSDIKTGIYMVLSLYLMGIIVDKIHNSHQRLTLIIVTQKPHDIRTALSENISRGCTVLDSYGGLEYTKNHTVLVTISKEELYKTIKVLKEADEKSFINILPVESVVGFFQNNFKRILD